MSYDLSFDRKTAILLATCTVATIILLVVAGFLLGTQYRRAPHPASHPSSEVKAKTTPSPAATPKTPLPAATATPPVAAPPPSTAPTPNSDSNPQADPPATPSDTPKSLPPETRTTAGYSLQFGAFREESNADVMVKQLKEKTVKAVIAPRTDAAGDTWYTVRFGNYPTLAAASAAAVPLRISTQHSILVRPADRP
ncbi:MAG: hypothetical protein BGO25_06780 [Acidobacteriales bacterium 59-55]|nr:MAG: hypothetical protein BGO25_06780 [Acidobacteriales bacterium 59-55]